MKIILYFYYFIRSIYYRGFINTLRLLSYEQFYEKKLGIHTHSIVHLKHLTLAGNNSDENHHYQGASYDVLFKIFQKLPLNIHQYTFVDFGCGKGRAIFVAEQCGFTKLIGVDIAQELIEQANANKLYYKPKQSESSIEFIFNERIQEPFIVFTSTQNIKPFLMKTASR
jgi:SAM-dependent methyltransferase